MDAANAPFGQGAVTLAATGIKKPWETKFEKRSPRYTTRLSDLPNLLASRAPSSACISVRNDPGAHESANAPTRSATTVSNASLNVSCENGFESTCSCR
jgi:hypothetical protein